MEALLNPVEDDREGQQSAETMRDLTKKMNTVTHQKFSNDLVGFTVLCMLKSNRKALQLTQEK